MIVTDLPNKHTISLHSKKTCAHHDVTRRIRNTIHLPDWLPDVCSTSTFCNDYSRLCGLVAKWFWCWTCDHGLLLHYQVQPWQLVHTPADITKPMVGWDVTTALTESNSRDTIRQGWPGSPVGWLPRDLGQLQTPVLALNRTVALPLLQVKMNCTKSYKGELLESLKQ